MRKLFFLLLVVGCQSRSQWHYDQIPSKEQKCTRLVYKSDDPIRGIDLEFLYTGKELATFLQVHSQLSSEEHNQALVRLTSGERSMEFLANLHLGKQRARLSSQAQDTLIEMLKLGNPVTIELKGYRETIPPARFEKGFKKLENPPYKVPFHLPI